MSLVSMFKRRQFLYAAVGSTCALTCKKLFAGSDIGGEFQSTSSFEAAARNTSGLAAGSRYPHLLSPLKIRNKMLKNRMIHTMGFPQHLNGPEAWPPEIYREYYARFARNGAAIVVVPPVVVAENVGKSGYGYREGPWSKEGRYGDDLRRATQDRFDTSNPACENYLDQMVASVHAYGSLVSEIGMVSNLKDGTVEDAVASAKALEDKGVDVILMPSSPAASYGPGAQAEKAASFDDPEFVRLNIERMEAIKKATNQIISMKINVTSTAEAVAIAKIYDGVLDILQFRKGMEPAPWDSPVMDIAKAIRDSGSKIYLAPNGGFQDLDENERYLASGVIDLITMCRAWLADFDYGQKAYEGRGEDVVPCIQCFKCHGQVMPGARGRLDIGPWISVCSVNPRLGLDPAVRVIAPPAVRKRVAVIGGGPAGMVAAITASERGHKVTLYEKDNVLGGLLKHSDFTPYPEGLGLLRKYKDYLIRQVKKAGVEVFLNKAVTAEMMKAKGYDAIVAAVGVEAGTHRIPGADGKNVYSLVDVYSREKELGKSVVVAGGGTFGVVTAMFLARCGHNVTVLTSDKELVTEKRIGFELKHKQLEQFTYVVEAVPTRISDGILRYKDAGGNEKSIHPDSIVLYAGLVPRQNEALSFSNAGARAFFSVGDCTGECGNLQKTVRNAYFSATQF